MLDIIALAKIVTSLLTPALPYLLKGSDSAWGEASKKIGADTWEWTKSIWFKLVSNPKANPNRGELATEVVKAATEVANDPSDEDAQAALRLQIKKLLTGDPELGLEITKVINEAKESSSEMSIRIGGVDISGNVTNYGDIIGRDKTINSGSNA